MSDEDWKIKEQEALNEGHHWAIQAGFQFDKTWENGKPSFNLYRQGKLIGSTSTAWKYRDMAYELCPYYEATPEEIKKHNRASQAEKRQQAAQKFIAEVIAAIKPETEEELFLAILDNDGCDWGLARSMFRQHNDSLS